MDDGAKRPEQDRQAAAPHANTTAPRDRPPGEPRGSGPGRGRGRPSGEQEARTGASEGRRRGGERRSYAGFGDGVERAFCANFRHLPPPGFPVQHRGGAATLRPVLVARREDAMLFCDGAHPGAHRWPDGEPVPTATEAAEDVGARA